MLNRLFLEGKKLLTVWETLSELLRLVLIGHHQCIEILLRAALELGWASVLTLLNGHEPSVRLACAHKELLHVLQPLRLKPR